MKKAITFIHTLRPRGFTFSELLVVIVVLGVLATLVLTSYGALQAKMRDVTRQSAINQITTQLEACYNTDCDSSYPTLTQLQDDNPKGWVASHFRGFNSSLLYDSKGHKIQGVSPSDAGEYQYEALTSDGSVCSAGQTCTSYKLRAWQEEDTATPYTKVSLHS